MIHSEHIEPNTFLDLLSYIYCLIDLCNNKNVHYYDQCLVIIETVATDDEDTINVTDLSSTISPYFFHKNKVSRLLVIERPKESNQVYIADGLHRKYHFSCLTSYVPSLFKEIEGQKNNELQLLFIPRSVNYFKNDAITVFNGLSIDNTFFGDDPTTIHRSVV